MKKKEQKNVGQCDIFGGIEGVEHLIEPAPEVIDCDGVKVVKVVIERSKSSIPGYIPEALKQARALVPEVRSTGKPPWYSAKWHINRRKREAKNR